MTHVPEPLFIDPIPKGVAPATLFTPASVEEASELLHAGASRRATVAFTGAKTKADWGAPLEDTDMQMSTTALAELISYHPGDMTAAVGAGLPLARLQPMLAEHGQWLALDPATEAAGATLGGLLATGDAGPRRLRYGTMRDLTIGTTLVLADGTVVHSGSHVIKNVAGYDLSKLFLGSLGSLGLIAEIIVRLHPRPAASRTVMAAASVGQARAATAELRSCGVEPAAIEWFGQVSAHPPQGSLLVRLEGGQAGVDAGSSRVIQLLRTLDLDADTLDGEAAEQWWTRCAQAGLGVPGGSVARIGTLPTKLDQTVRAMAAAADSHGLAATLTSSTALGLHTAALTGDSAAQAAVLLQWRTAVQHLGGTLTLRRRPPAVTAAVDAYGQTPSSVAYLRAVKNQLDPDHRCSPGRFPAWT